MGASAGPVGGEEAGEPCYVFVGAPRVTGIAAHETESIRIGKVDRAVSLWATWFVKAGAFGFGPRGNRTGSSCLSETKNK